MPQLDAATFLPQLFWLAVSFGALYLIMSRFALPRVGDMLQARRERIEADLGRAEDLRGEAAEMLAAYESAMAEARGEAHRLTVQAAQDAAAEAARRHAELAARLEAEAARAEARIAEAGARALADMRAHAAGIVREASVKLAGVAPSEAAVTAALEDPR